MTLLPSLRPQLSSWQLAQEKFELALPLLVERPAARAERFEPWVLTGRDRHARATAWQRKPQARAARGFPSGKVSRSASILAAQIDAALEVDRAAAARRNRPDSARRRPSCSTAASPWQSAQERPRAPALPFQSASPSSNPQHARIRGVVLLHRLRVAAHELEAGASLGRRRFGSAKSRCKGRARIQPGGDARALGGSRLIRP